MTAHKHQLPLPQDPFDESRAPVAAIPGEEPDSFVRELAALAPLLTRRAQLLTPDRACAEDLVQETLARALANRHQFRRGSNLRSWTSSILRNLFIDDCRRNKLSSQYQHQQTEPLQFAEPNLSPIDLVDSDDVLRALDTLSEEQRELFDLAYARSMSYRTIADRFGIRVSTVGTRLFRTRAKLRTMLERAAEQRLEVHRGKVASLVRYHARP